MRMKEKRKEYLELEIRNASDCPMCGSRNVGCVDSRDFRNIRERRRKCRDCNHSFWTVEVMTDDLDRILYSMEKIKSMKKELEEIINNV